LWRAYPIKLTTAQLMAGILILGSDHSSKGRQATTSGARSITMKSLFSRFVKDESGATAIEYALIAAVIGLGILTGAQGLKNAINTKYSGVATNLGTAN
jgi:pilus assembly protein Flp/PilA